jgi:hypothetical protein
LPELGFPAGEFRSAGCKRGFRLFDFSRGVRFGLCLVEASLAHLLGICGELLLQLRHAPLIAHDTGFLRVPKCFILCTGKDREHLAHLHRITFSHLEVHNLSGDFGRDVNRVAIDSAAYEERACGFLIPFTTRQNQHQ